MFQICKTYAIPMYRGLFNAKNPTVAVASESVHVVLSIRSLVVAVLLPFVAQLAQLIVAGLIVSESRVSKSESESEMIE